MGDVKLVGADKMSSLLVLIDRFFGGRLEKYKDWIDKTTVVDFLKKRRSDRVEYLVELAPTADIYFRSYDSINNKRLKSYNMQETMKAIAIENYGGIEEALKAKEVPSPSAPEGRDILIRVKATSINPIDTKVRARAYDDYPNYYSLVASNCSSSSSSSFQQIPGYDASGIVESAGPSCRFFKPGDKVYYSGSPIRNGSNAELQLVDERLVARMPGNLDFCEAAAMPLTWITAWEALVERLGIKRGEGDGGLLIINGAGGVGAVATQIARAVLELPVVVTTASRDETRAFSKSMGATHIINHREDLVQQVEALKLEVPIKHIFITHSTDQYMSACSHILAPFGKVVSIVQGKAEMYGLPFMAKSLSYHWCLLGTKPVYGVEMDGQRSHRAILEELRSLLESGKVKCHLRRRLPLTLEGVREAHGIIEHGGSIGKVALGVGEAEDSGKVAFA